MHKQPYILFSPPPECKPPLHCLPGEESTCRANVMMAGPVFYYVHFVKILPNKDYLLAIEGDGIFLESLQNPDGIQIKRQGNSNSGMRSFIEIEIDTQGINAVETSFTIKIGIRPGDWAGATDIQYSCKEITLSPQLSKSL